MVIVDDSEEAPKPLTFAARRTVIDAILKMQAEGKAFYVSWPHKFGKSQALRDWAVANGETPRVISKANTPNNLAGLKPV